MPHSRSTLPNTTEQRSSQTVDHAAARVRESLVRLGGEPLASHVVVSPGRSWIRLLQPSGAPICRVRTSDDADRWHLQMFKWSDERYDTQNDFMYSSGPLDDCVEIALRAANIT